MTSEIPNNPQSTPILPQQSIEPRNIWPINIGNSILQSFSDHSLEYKQFGLGGWQVDVGSSWRLISNNIDVYTSVNQARQNFVELVNVQKIVEVCFPNQRCLVMVDESNKDDQKWRIWQIIKQGVSLNDFLLKDLNTRPVKKTAEIFFIAAEKFYSAVKTFSDKKVHLLFDLNNIGIQSGNLIFIGRLPCMNDEIAAQPVLEQLKNAFITPVDVFLSGAQANYSSDVIRYLDVYAKGNSEYEDLIQVLKSLLQRESV